MKRSVMKLLLQVSALAVLSVLLVSPFSGWAKNPYGLEAARLGPKGNEQLPTIVLVAAAQNYLLFPRHENNIYAVHLPIPHDYFHASNTTSRPIKAYGADVTMYFPEMHSRFHPKNAHLLKCNGYCEGYIRVSINPNEKDARSLNARKMELIETDRTSSKPHLRFDDLESAFGLDEHFQIRFAAIEAKSNGSRSSTKEYLIKRDRNGAIQYLFECSPHNPSPACSVRFNLSARPELLIDARFGRHLMGSWKEIVESVDTKVSSWGPVRVDTRP